MSSSASAQWAVKDSYVRLFPQLNINLHQPYSPGVVSLLERGLLANQTNHDNQANTLSSIIAAFFVLEEEISRWLEKFVEYWNNNGNNSINIINNIRRWREGLEGFPELENLRTMSFTISTSSSEIPLNNYVRSISRSVDNVIHIATAIAGRIDHKDRSNYRLIPPILEKSNNFLQLHHIMAALIFYPRDVSMPKSYLYDLLFFNHEPSPTSYQDLMNSFLTFIQIKHQDMYEDYLKEAQLNGLSIHDSDTQMDTYLRSVKTQFNDDKPASKDKFGYRSYVSALKLFLDDENTHPPLTLSIQAPWGSGKSSIVEQLILELEPITALSYPSKDEQFKVLFPSENSLNDETNDVSYFNILQSLLEIKRDINLSQRFQLEPVFDSTTTISNPHESRNFIIKFNAWKYENSDQIWAGLMETIYTSFSEILPNDHSRRLFWLHLHLLREDELIFQEEITRVNRSDANKKKEQLRESISKNAALLGSGLAIIFAILSSVFGLSFLEGLGLTVSQIILTSIVAILTYRIQSEKFETLEPSFINTYFSRPDYSKSTGLPHQAVKDLSNIFQIMNSSIEKVFIFIDDLDRCSSDHVSEVFEAINLIFYSLNDTKTFENNFNPLDKIIFIAALDAEKTAEALNKKYSIKSTTLVGNNSLGWKFMNKFVQIPFTIPQIPERLTRQFLKELTEQTNVSSEELFLTSSTTISAQSTQEAQDFPLEPQTTTNNSTFETNLGLSKAIIDIGTKYCSSPRQMKRFVNVVRLYYYIKNIKGWAIPDSSLASWALINVEWPSFVNWYTKESTKLIYKDKTQGYVLLQLRELAESSQDHKQWENEVLTKFNSSSTSPWRSEENLFHFMKNQNQSNDPLDSVENHDLW